MDQSALTAALAYTAVAGTATPCENPAGGAPEAIVKRGEVYIAPTASVPGRSMIDPTTARFAVSWQDDCVLEDAEIVGADAALAWARQRSEKVYIRLGHTDSTYFFAGTVRPEGETMPDWPPERPPPEGWWQPPPMPTLAEVAAVRAAMMEGAIEVEAVRQWVADRVWLDDMTLDVQRALGELDWYANPRTARFGPPHFYGDDSTGTDRTEP